MPDVFSKIKRSEVMSRQQGGGTGAGQKLGGLPKIGCSPNVIAQCRKSRGQA